MRKIIIVVVALCIINTGYFLGSSIQDNPSNFKLNILYKMAPGFHPVDGYAYAQLWNRENQIGQTGYGDSHVYLIDGNNKQICESSYTNIKPGQHIACSKTGLSYKLYYTEGKWTVIHSTDDMIYTELA
ncbi:MAG: hypothetical protein ACK5HS_03770 [Mycoplasmatales bacterium]